MKTQNTPNAKQFQETTIKYLDTLKQDPNDKSKSLLEIKITGGYFELAIRAKSIIAVCQSALMSQEFKSEYHTHLDLTSVLELANQMILLNEAEYLDQMRALASNEDNKA
jgi:hypothetical protein